MRSIRLLLDRFPATQVDVAIAAVIALVGVVEVLGMDDRQGPVLANVMAIVALAATLAWRRRRPLAMAIAIVVLATLQSWLLTDSSAFGATFVLLLLASYSVGAFAREREALGGYAALLVLVGIVNLLSGEAMNFGDFLFPGGLVTLFWLAGRTARHRARLAEAMHELAVRAAEERDAQRTAAVADERRRLAREMHDIVAHSISVMVVQAGGARRILDRDPARAVEAAARIEETGREAMSEMRRLLGVLRAAEQPGRRAPQPGLAGLDALVRRARDAGLAVELRVDGERRDLPGGIDLAAYRLVQEALTNCLRHAGGAAAEVTLRYGPEALELEVADRGPGPAGGSGGHGLVGMRERVRVHGGELEAGPRPGGGFAVRARLPVGAGEALPA